MRKPLIVALGILLAGGLGSVSASDPNTGPSEEGGTGGGGQGGGGGGANTISLDSVVSIGNGEMAYGGGFTFKQNVTLDEVVMYVFPKGGGQMKSKSHTTQFNHTTKQWGAHSWAGLYSGPTMFRVEGRFSDGSKAYSGFMEKTVPGNNPPPTGKVKYDIGYPSNAAKNTTVVAKGTYDFGGENGASAMGATFEARTSPSNTKASAITLTPNGNSGAWSAADLVLPLPATPPEQFWKVTAYNNSNSGKTFTSPTDEIKVLTPP